jgi:hypothetical protein
MPRNIQRAPRCCPSERFRRSDAVVAAQFTTHFRCDDSLIIHGRFRIPAAVPACTSPLPAAGRVPIVLPAGTQARPCSSFSRPPLPPPPSLPPSQSPPAGLTMRKTHSSEAAALSAAAGRLLHYLPQQGGCCIICRSREAAALSAAAGRLLPQHSSTVGGA